MPRRHWLGYLTSWMLGALEQSHAEIEEAAARAERIEHVPTHTVVRYFAAMREMLAPLSAAGSPDAEQHAARLTALLAEPWLRDGLTDRRAVARMTSGAPEAGDSLHLLVMDLHKALNALQASIASEDIDGALAYGLAPQDRARASANRAASVASSAEAPPCVASIRCASSSRARISR